MRIVLGGLLAVFAVSAAPRKALRIQRVGDGGLVALANGAVLAWNTRADIQLRSIEGTWGPVRHLPTGFVESATVRNGLVYLQAETVDSVMRAVRSQLFSIRQDGTATELPGLPDVGPVFVSRQGLAPIRCTPADASKATYHPPICESDSPAWKAVGSWTDPPFPCGDTLVERGRRALVTRSFEDGRRLASRPLPDTAALACGDRSVLIGTDRIVALDPRTLRPQWSVRVNERPITALCATPKEIVYFAPSGPGSVQRPDRP